MNNNNNKKTERIGFYGIKFKTGEVMKYVWNGLCELKDYAKGFVKDS